MRSNHSVHFVLFSMLLFSFSQVACTNHGAIAGFADDEQTNCESLCVHDVLWTVKVSDQEYLLKAHKADSAQSLLLWKLTSPELEFDNSNMHGQIIADKAEWQTDAKIIILSGNIKASFDELKLHTDKLIINLNQQSWKAPGRIEFWGNNVKAKAASGGGRLDQDQQIKLLQVELALGENTSFETKTKGDITK